MKKFFSLALGAMIAALCLTGCKTRQMLSPAIKADKSIVIIYDNDVHCGINGYARMAGLRDAVSDTAWTALVSSGDYLQGGTAGAISKGQYIADIMKVMNYDAVTLGNHEFDYNVADVKRLLTSANLPVTCSNFFETATGKLVYAPYIMKDYGGKKVAFVGAVTTTTLYTEAFAFYDENNQVKYNLCEKDVYAKIQEAVDAARQAGATYVVVLSHLGEAKNELNCDSYGLVASTRGIDAVLDGHTHSSIECAYVSNLDGKQIPVSQTGTKFENVGKMVINSLGQISTQLVPLKDIVVENARVREVTDSINGLMEIVTKRPVCQNDYVINILDADQRQQVRYAETNSGDLVTDAYISMTSADVAITNGGGIRAGLEPGALTYGDIVGMLPYDNYLNVVEITGKKLQEVLEACCRFTPEENGDFPQVSGMKYTIDMTKTSRVQDLMILDKATGQYVPVDENRKYTLATIDYCVIGGGLQGVLKDSRIVKENVCRYNDALVTYIVETLGGKIPEQYAKPQGRITIKK